MIKFLIISLVSLFLFSCQESNTQNEEVKESQSISETQNVENLMGEIELLLNSKKSAKILGNFKSGGKRSSYMIVKNLRNGQVFPIVMNNSEDFMFGFGAGLSLKEVGKKTLAGGYLVSCSGGSHDGDSGMYTSKMGAANAVGECLDGGGCAEACLAPNAIRVDQGINEISRLLEENEDLSVDDNGFLILDRTFLEGLDVRKDDKFTAAGILVDF